MSCELRFHGESYGWEVQFFERGELFYGRGGFVMRELAVRWAEHERTAMEGMSVVRSSAAPGDVATSIGLEPGDDPATILRNGLKIVELLKREITQTIIAAPSPRIRGLLSSRIGPPPAALGTAVAAGILTALPSSLVKHDKLKADRAFHRFSAFSPDRRVDPKTGSFLAGTYAAPASEVPFVPTGFVAVGRFALPVNLPASHHYEIKAPAATHVDFGTVAPAFGQSGGGVEAYFAKAVRNAQMPPTTHKPLPDE